ncbi:hypothetical protein CCP3SC5AM1_2360001 [Gammaproteobacteria bacterium]
MCDKQRLHGGRRWFLKGMTGIGAGLLLEGCANTGSQAVLDLTPVIRPLADLKVTNARGCALVGSQAQGVIARLSQLAASG